MFVNNLTHTQARRCRHILCRVRQDPVLHHLSWQGPKVPAQNVSPPSGLAVGEPRNPVVATTGRGYVGTFGPELRRTERLDHFKDDEECQSFLAEVNALFNSG